ncbi:alpha/beta fold hydrolase [Streptosporangium sp. KLBMP 9127]|nr:alpha/beta hydrolase [Streptosporangium sp. KLBMP 9127]
MTVPIVLIHGIRVSRTMWNPVMARITSNPIKAIDLPGHGLRRGESFTMEGAVAAVAGAIDEVGGRALVAGLSLGGYVAIATAERFPGRVAGLVPMGCTALPDHAHLRFYRRAAALAARNPEVANRISALGFTVALPRTVGRAVMTGGFSCEVMPAAVEAVAAHDQLAALAAYPGRVWLVNGSRDPFRVNEREFLGACRQGRLIVVPRRGHVGLLVETARLARLLGDFAEELREPLETVATPSRAPAAPIPLPTGPAADKLSSADHRTPRP